MIKEEIIKILNNDFNFLYNWKKYPVLINERSLENIKLITALLVHFGLERKIRHSPLEI